ncbi:MAG: hypothetical protein AB7V27_11105 [Candidatus Binatia bacterium]
MSILLRVAAIYFLVWAICLAVPNVLPPGVAPEGAAGRSLALNLAAANVGYALLLWRAARNPVESTIIIYAALVLFGLRAAIGTYQVLYSESATTLQLIDLGLCLPAFVGILNLLPRALGQKTSTAGSADRAR